MVYTVNTQVYARYMHVYANFIQLTIYWFDWDSMLDEASINVDYDQNYSWYIKNILVSICIVYTQHIRNIYIVYHKHHGTKSCKA